MVWPRRSDGTFDELVRVQHPMRPETIAQISERMDAREFLEERGMSFYEGTSAEFDLAANLLIVVNTQDEFDLIEADSGCTMNEPSWRDRVLGWWYSLSSPRPAPPGPPPGSSIP